MLRLAFAIGIVAFIFVHSPERPSNTVSEDAGRLAGWTRREITEAAIRSGAAQDLLRSALADAKPTLRPTH